MNVLPPRGSQPVACFQIDLVAHKSMTIEIKLGKYDMARKVLEEVRVLKTKVTFISKVDNGAVGTVQKATIH